MEVTLNNLITHKYDSKGLINKWTFNTIKSEVIDWLNKSYYNSPFYNDIVNSTLCYAIEDIDTGEEFAYYFINKEYLTENNVYYLTKVVFDTELSDECIEFFTKKLLKRIVDQNGLQKDRIITKGNLPLATYCFTDTTNKVVKEIKDAVQLCRSEIVKLPEDLENRILKK